MKVRELYNNLEAHIPHNLSCEWDNDGLMCCPDPERLVKRVLVGLDISEKAVDKALSEGFDVILSHHPLVFRPVNTLTTDEATQRKLIRLAQGGIAAMSFHTRLDALEGGVNDVLAVAIGLKNTVPFGPEGEKMGRIGELAEEMSLPAFAALIKSRLRAPVVFFNGERPVKKVAVLGGNGDDFVFAAKAMGADTYVSGRLGYHPMASATEDGINLVEAGHFYTEQPVLSVLGEFVKQADPEIEVVFYSSNEISAI